MGIAVIRFSKSLTFFALGACRVIEVLKHRIELGDVRTSRDEGGTVGGENLAAGFSHRGSRKHPGIWMSALDLSKL